MCARRVSLSPRVATCAVQTALAQLQNATPQDLWLADLEALQKALVQLSGYSGGKAS